MLVVTLGLDGERYALRASEILEIVPLIKLKKLPKAPKAVAGLFHYRGQVTPVLDLGGLTTGSRARHLMSTRIIVVDYRDAAGKSHPLGIVAEGVTDAIELGGVEPAGVNVPAAPFLGGVVTEPAGMIQLVEVGELLSAELRSLLFPSEASDAR
jgi:chemotaxis-related protein WspB